MTGVALRIFAVSAALVSGAVEANEASTYVTPYLEGLLPAVVSLRHLSRVSTDCETHFKEGCERLSQGVRSIQGEMRAEMTHITVVDIQAIPDRSAQYWEKDLSREFSASRADFLSDVMHYDVQLVSHYAAARAACPPASGTMDPPRFLEGILHLYWGLDGKELQEQMDSMHELSTKYGRELAGSPKSCESIRELGYVIAREMVHRLKKFDADHSLPRNSINGRLGISVEYLWDVIAALEIEVGNQHFIHEYLRDDVIKAGVFRW